MSDTTTCRFCGDTLYPVALPGDEWGVVDDRGSTLGTDPDLRHLPNENPYARLAELAERMAAFPKRKAGAGITAEEHRIAAEYHALKTRTDFKLSFHEHRPIEHIPAPGHPEPTPYSCGMPAWLRPSGWYCREHTRPLPCPHEIEAVSA